MALLLREAEVRQLLVMDEVLQLVEEGFRELANDEAINRPRSRVFMPKGVLHVMSAGDPKRGVLGLKAYTAFRTGVRFLVLLYSAEDGQLLAMMEADALGQFRTGAASGVATKFLARPDAATAGVIGTGWQARTQLQAVCAVRPIRRTRAFGRDPERRRKFAEELSQTTGVEVVPVESAEEAVRNADVVITMTSAPVPVLAGAWLAPGTHVNAAGNNRADRREIDGEVVRRAGLIAVDSKEQAQIEAGDLLMPIEAGVLSWDRVHELGDVVAGRVKGRTSNEEITLFKSLGLAIEDVVVAQRVYELARSKGIGEEIPLFS